MPDLIDSVLVSLGVPVYNGEAYISECLAALTAQDHEHIEIVVSDNASTDGTADIVQELATADSRIRYLPHEENRGAAWNYNNCVAQSRGSYFSWTAHDDVRPPAFVRASLEGFGRVPDASVVYGTSDFIDAEGDVIAPDRDILHTISRWPHVRLGAALRSVNFAAPVFGLFPRTVLDRTRLIGGFTASDYVLICELAMLGPIVMVDTFTMARRLHPASSREANRTREAVQAWFDPSADHDRLSDRQRLFVEYQRSVGSLGLSRQDRLLCRATIPAVSSYRRARVIGGAWKDRVLRRPAELHARDIMDQRTSSS